MDYVIREVEENQIVEEAIDPDGYRKICHVKENCAGEPLSAEIPGYSFTQAGQMRVCVMSGSEPKLLSRNSPLSFKTCKILASRKFSNKLPVVSKRLLGR